jgi:hypothetical protein
MRLIKQCTEPLSAPSAAALHGGGRALALAGESTRLNWNCASQRIVRKAQERVAVETALLSGC